MWAYFSLTAYQTKIMLYKMSVQVSSGHYVRCLQDVMLYSVLYEVLTKAKQIP